MKAKKWFVGVFIALAAMAAYSGHTTKNVDESNSNPIAPMVAKIGPYFNV